MQYFGGTVQQQFWSGTDSLSYAGVKKSDLLIPFSTDIIMRVERNLHWNKDMSHLYRNIKM